MVVAVTSDVRFSALPRCGQRLIRLMQHLGFGRIVGLSVRNGRPDFAQAYHTVRTVKLAGGDNAGRTEAGLNDFELRSEHRALLRHIHELPDGSRLTIEVRHGLPFMAEIQEEHRA